MKQIYLLSGLLLLSSASTVLAYDVPTDVQKKNVLIEEFTGIHCGYCPEAHVIAHNLNYLHPTRIFSIAVHSGSYAIPGPDEPDYRTADGNSIDEGLGTTNAGRPCGVLNRADFSGSFILNRGIWSQVCKSIMKEDAPVNLLIKSECDASTRELKITVEGYCTGDMPSEKAYLSVALTQDNIKGPQSGGGVGSDYVHMSMLRDYISDVWGDEVSVAKGEYFTKEYTYTIPEQIYAPSASKGVAVTFPDINVIAFLSEEGKSNIMNVASVRPEYKNLEMSLSAEISKPLLGISKKWGFEYFEVVLTNNSVEALTSADFEVTLNGETQASRWEGELAPMSWQVVKVPFELGESVYYNSWGVKLEKVNDTEVAASEVSGTFTQPANATPEIRVTIQTDENTDENLWRILDSEGNEVMTFEPEAGKATQIKELVTLESGKVYCFEVTDAWADGIDGGSFKLSNSDGSLIEQNYAIPNMGYRSFFVTSLSGVEGLEAEALMLEYENGIVKAGEGARIEVYSADGGLVGSGCGEFDTVSLEGGFYVAVAVTGTERVVKKIIVK